MIKRYLVKIICFCLISCGSGFDKLRDDGSTNFNGQSIDCLYLNSRVVQKYLERTLIDRLGDWDYENAKYSGRFFGWKNISFAELNNVKLEIFMMDLMSERSGKLEYDNTLITIAVVSSAGENLILDKTYKNLIIDYFQNMIDDILISVGDK